MLFSVNTNNNSLNAQKALMRTNVGLNKSVQKLSTGSRINSSSDDAAGLSIAENLKSRTMGYRQARSNGIQATAMLQTADSALQTVSNTLMRMRELAVQAGSDNLSTDDRTSSQREFRALASEIRRIFSATEYNGTKLLNGTQGNGVSGPGSFQFQIGTGTSVATDTISVNLGSGSGAISGLTDLLSGGTTSSISGSTLTPALAAVDNIDLALKSVNERRATIGAGVNRLGATVDFLNSAIENLQQAEGNIRDTDYGFESANFSRQQVLQQSAVSMLSQANSQPQLALRLLG
jgi:flagellin